MAGYVKECPLKVKGFWTNAEKRSDFCAGIASQINF
jgi:hypothetical protein